MTSSSKVYLITDAARGTEPEKSKLLKLKVP
jgi:hypothetical protein